MIPSNLDNIYSQVSKKLKIPKSEVKKVISDVFDLLRKDLRNIEEMPVLLHYFGSFEINKNALKKYLSYRKLDIEEKERLINIYENISNKKYKQ